MKKKILFTAACMAICNFTHSAEHQNNQSPLQPTHSLLQIISNQDSSTSALQNSSNFFNSSFENTFANPQFDFSTNANEQSNVDKPTETNNAVFSLYDKIEQSATPKKTKFTVNTFGNFQQQKSSEDQLNKYLSALRSQPTS